jgi:hypothetical protein
MTDFEELDERDRALARKLRAQLRASEDFDYVTQARLSAARARAVAASRRPAGWWFATGGLTAAAVLAVVLVLRVPQTAAPTTADSLELMTDELEPEFYQDLEMYQWLADTGADSA